MTVNVPSTCWSFRSSSVVIIGVRVDTLKCFYKERLQNFSLVMAMAADLVIVEAEEIVQPGELKAEYDDFGIFVIIS